MVIGQKIPVSIFEEGTREVYIRAINEYCGVFWGFFFFFTLCKVLFLSHLTKGTMKEILYGALFWYHIPEKGSGIINKSVTP